jgi:hypothetical protein
LHREWCCSESELISHFVGNMVSCSIKSRFPLTSVFLEVQETHLRADVTTNFVEWDGMGWDGMVVLGGKSSKIDVLVQDNNINQIGYIESDVLVIRAYFYLFHILLASDLLLFTFALRVNFLNLEKYGSSKSTQCVVTMASPYYCLSIFLTKWPSYPIPSHLPKLVATFAWE